MLSQLNRSAVNLQQHSSKGQATHSGIAPGKDSTTQRSYSIHDFEVGRKLGTGRFGNVYVAREKRHGFPCALKV
jgi:aurora kinase B